MPRKHSTARRTYRPLTARQQQLVLDNIGLAKKMAGKVARGLARSWWGYKGEQVYADQFYDELLGAAVTGLCVAVQRYDPSKGVKLSTFAHYCIRSFLSRARDSVRLLQAHKSGRRMVVTPMIFFGEMRNSEPHGDDGRNTKQIDVWDSRDDRCEEVPTELHADIVALLFRGLLPRQMRLVRRVVLDGALMETVAAEEGIGYERVRQIVRKALARLKGRDEFMAALARHVYHRRQNVSASDFVGTGAFTLIA